LNIAHEVQVVEVPEQVRQLESHERQEVPERNLLEEQLRQLELAFYYLSLILIQMIITNVK